MVNTPLGLIVEDSPNMMAHGFKAINSYSKHANAWKYALTGSK